MPVRFRVLVLFRVAAFDLVDGAGPFLQLLDIGADVLDRRAVDNLFPRGALSVDAPIGLALWILSLHG